MSLDAGHIEQEQTPQGETHHCDSAQDGSRAKCTQSKSPTPQLANDALGEMFELSRSIQVRVHS